MSKQTALRSILFSILTFSIIPIFCPPKTKTPRRVALSIKALPSIVGLYTMLQTLTPQIIIHSEPHMAKCQELCSCIDSMTSCNLERFKKTYAEHLFTPAEGNFFDKDPFTLGYLFGIEAHKREKIIGKSQETGAKAIALVIMLIPLFDEIDDSLAKKFLAFISGYQYFMLSHREESTIPPIEELPKQNEDTFISFLLGMNAATTSIMGEPNLSPTTIVDHAFNCGYYIQIYLNKKEVAAPVADATPFLITDHTVATERPPREYVRTTNECYASGILLERSLSPMLHDTTAMSDQLTSFLAAEILKLSTTPTTLMGPIFQTCGALEFYSLRQLKLFAPSADHLETTLINKCFENGYNCSYDNLCTYISKNFTKKRDLVRNLSNLLMRAYIAGAILKMIVQAHLKEKTSIAYISVEVFIQTKDRWLAVIESLEDKATKSTSSNGAAASATSTRTYEEAKAAEEELLALLAAEEEEREAQKLSKSQAQERKKIRQRALAEQRKKEALELAERERQRLEAQKEAHKKASQEKTASTTAGTTAATPTEKVTKKKKRKKEGSAPRPVPSLPLAAPAPTAQEMPATVARSASADSPRSSTSSPHRRSPSPAPRDHAEPSSTEDTPSTPSTSPASTVISSVSAMDTDHSPQSPKTHYETGRYEGQKLCEKYSPQQLLNEASWHVHFFETNLGAPGAVVSLEYWQGRLAAIQFEHEKTSPETQAALMTRYKNGLAEGEAAKKEANDGFFKSISDQLARHESAKHPSIEWHSHWIYLKGCAHGYRGLPKSD